MSLDTNSKQEAEQVNLMLNGSRVTAGFRAALFDAANRAGVTVNEYVIRAAGEKLAANGAIFPGVFRPSDIEEMSVGGGCLRRDHAV